VEQENWKNTVGWQPVSVLWTESQAIRQARPLLEDAVGVTAIGTAERHLRLRRAQLAMAAEDWDVVRISARFFELTPANVPTLPPSSQFNPAEEVRIWSEIDHRVRKRMALIESRCSNLERQPSKARVSSCTERLKNALSRTHRVI